MIEILETKKGNYLPCEEVIYYLKKIKDERLCPHICVGEIGVDIGATAVEIIRLLEADDKYFYFDFAGKINELENDFSKMKSDAKLFGIGNTPKYSDSYAWSLTKLISEDQYGFEGFDLVYLDGAHSFLHDAAATAMLKEMMNTGGILIFDDIEWSVENSPTVNPEKCPFMLELYTDELIKTCQVAWVVKCIMEPDKRYRRIECDNSNKAVFERIG